jgi:hypothetical protein
MVETSIGVARVEELSSKVQDLPEKYNSGNLSILTPEMNRDLSMLTCHIFIGIQYTPDEYARYYKKILL